MAIGTQQLSTEEWESRVGEQIRELRLSSALDQSQLAEAADVSVGAVKNLEQGRGSSLKTLLRVVRALGRTDWLLELAPPIGVSPIELLRSGRREPRARVYRPRTKRD
jgi:transcriptional regulator with XRE-family HTH domain